LKRSRGNFFALLAVTELSLFVPHILQKVIDDGLLKGQAGYLARAALPVEDVVEIRVA
jgi:hypothetical protein